MANYNNYNEVFDSLAAFENAVDGRDLNKVFEYRKDCLSSEKDDFEFSGTKDYSEASVLMLSGDTSNLDKLVAVSGVDLSTVTGTKKVNRQQKAVCGGFPLVPLYLTGVPKNMLTAKKVTTKTKVITLAYNIAVNCDTPANDMVVAGAKVASIIRYLEQKGIRCNLYVVNASKKNSQSLSFAIKIKDAGAPLNLLNIAYPLINPSMLRRHFLRFVERCPIAIQDGFSFGYGTSYSVTKDSEICKKIGSNVTVINCLQILKSDVNEIAESLIKSISI